MSDTVATLTPFCVAEITKRTWLNGQSIDGDVRDLGDRFAAVIESHRLNRYRLHSFHFQCTRIGLRQDELRETIIAVFEAIPDYSKLQVGEFAEQYRTQT